MYVIGTAGHVDHGKSTLVQALTGIDPDRLREEKERGLTIDLGFAWLTLPGGEEVSIVDVPGHDRFIKNMLAGAGGIDIALLVIAADEGVMPQTREHLAILDLLGVSHGVIALTKADLVEDDLLDLAGADVEETLRGTSLEGAPVVRCSGVTRQGLDDLLSQIERAIATTPARRDIGRPRLPIDRAFTMAGFGTVVTGTLIDGSLSTGDEVEILPDETRSRIRGLQSHGRKVEVAPPGRRTAINLAGISVEDLRRGLVVTRPGWLKPTASVDVRLRTVRYVKRPLRHNLNITFHTGTAEVEGKLLLLDRNDVPPGEEAWAQVRLAHHVAAVRGDRFIIRDPNDTLAGGRIVDTSVRRHRRFHGPTIASLESMEKGSPKELVALELARLEPVTLRDLVRAVEADARTAQDAARELVRAGEAVCADEPVLENSLLYTRTGFAALTARMQETLGEYHREAPLRRGMPSEELRNRLGMKARAFEQALAIWEREGSLRDETGAVALPTHELSLTPQQRTAADAYLAALRDNPYAPDAPPPSDGLLSYLEHAGDVVRVAENVVFAAEAYRDMEEQIIQHLREHGTVTLAAVRDMFSTSRKYAQALLEYLDSRHITRRVGDERVLARRG